MAMSKHKSLANGVKIFCVNIIMILVYCTVMLWITYYNRLPILSKYKFFIVMYRWPPNVIWNLCMEKYLNLYQNIAFTNFTPYITVERQWQCKTLIHVHGIERYHYLYLVLMCLTACLMIFFKVNVQCLVRTMNELTKIKR